MSPSRRASDSRGPVLVREARLADAPEIARRNLAMAEETEGRRLDPAVLEAGVRAVFDDGARGVYWVAERAGRAVGCLLVTLEWSDWRNGWFWWIQSVYVDAAERRSGVFRALYAHLERTARATPGVAGLRLYVEGANTGAQSVYERLGMQRTGYRLYEAEFR